MPNINALVERNADRPFKVIGVDTGDDEKTFRNGLEEHELNWSRIAWQGMKGTPIADLYRVHSYPTIFVLDAEGRIVAKNAKGASLERVVGEQLAKLAE